MTAKKRLTSTNGNRTIALSLEASQAVDATTQKLLARLQELEREKWRLSRDINAIQTALRLAGVRPDGDGDRTKVEHHETDYVVKQPFAEITLVDACKKILRDYRGHWLTKSQLEYLVVRGGYKFSTDDSKNSVDVTMRRLAAEGFCEAERVRGSRGNKYRVFAEPKNADA